MTDTPPSTPNTPSICADCIAKLLGFSKQRSEHSLNLHPDHGCGHAWDGDITGERPDHHQQRGGQAEGGAGVRPHLRHRAQVHREQARPQALQPGRSVPQDFWENFFRKEGLKTIIIRGLLNQRDLFEVLEASPCIGWDDTDGYLQYQRDPGVDLLGRLLGGGGAAQTTGGSH